MFFLTVAAPPPGEDALLDTYISHIALGSQDALAALYQRTHAAAYGFALSILKNAHDAEVYCRMSTSRCGTAPPVTAPTERPWAG